MKHEWITLKLHKPITICHWCGVSKATHEHIPCKSKVKITTKGGKLTVITRKC